MKKAQKYVDKKTGKPVDQNDPASLDIEMQLAPDKNDIGGLQKSRALTPEEIARFEDEYDSDPSISRSMTLSQYIQLRDNQTP